MHINNNAQANYIYQIQNKISTILNHDVPTPSKATTDTVSTSNAGLNAKANWQEVANNYDVTNISQNEMGGMVSGLFDKNLISSTDSLYIMAPRSMNLDPDAKFDLLASTRKALAFAKKHGDSAEGIKNQERVVNILKNLQEILRKDS